MDKANRDAMNAMAADRLADLLSRLEANDIKLVLDGEQLRFNAPKGAMTPDLLEDLKASKQDLIDHLRMLNEADRQIREPIAVLGHANATDGSPLSFAQRRFWFLDRLAGGNSPIYNMLPIALNVDGPLDPSLLRKAMQYIVERHTVLSNRFGIAGDEPRQWPGQPGEVEVEIIELDEHAHTSDDAGSAPSDKPSDTATSADTSTTSPGASDLSEHIRREGERPFNLSEGGPLMRIALLRHSATHHTLVLTVHHIVADGWSLGILVEEVSIAYRAFSQGSEPDLPPLIVQYADFAAWERQRLTGPHLRRHLSYWRQALSGAPTLLELPTDRLRPRLQTYNGRTHPFLLGPDVMASIRDCVRTEGVTPFMILLSAFGMLLSRYAGVDDMVIGSPRSVREHPQTEPLIGLFLNTLPLRIDLSGEPTFRTLLSRVKAMALGAYEHGEVPFDELLQALGIERALNHTPLFQVLFALQNAPVGPLDLGNLLITPVETENSKAPFDLVLSMEELGDGFEGRFRYNTDLFDHDTVARMAGHFTRLLQAALQQPDVPVQQLSMLDEQEIAQLKQLSGEGVDYPVEETLHRRFERMASDTPDADALTFEGETWTYARLDEGANRIARRLMDVGIVPGDRVGLCMARSAELLPSLIGILKTGAAYVPLDPTYPSDRIVYMMEDSGLKVVLSDPDSMRTLSAGDLAERGMGLGAESQATPGTPHWIDSHEVLQNDVPSGKASRHRAASAPVIPPDTPAYVIYTSGSTGRPKGVEVTHANVMRLFLATDRDYGFGREDVWTLFHSYSFDFSVWEIWGALLYGGRLVVVPFGVSRSPDAFLDLLLQEQVTVLNQTPSAFQQLMDADRRREGPRNALKWVIFGGEALDLRSLEAWFSRHGYDQPQLVNMYGITETTVHVTFHRITREDVEAGASVIGRPISDLTLDLVDRSGQPVPIGVPGEIVVGGAGVANGYLNRPELTAERFVAPESLGLDHPGRIYRSGDLARRRSNGRLDYLGRIDQQVKIRGFRIELGEIESRITSHPEVSAATVVVVHADGGPPSLAAYVVFNDSDPVSAPAETSLRALRERLRSELPDYMVPAHLIPMERLPLTANGKIDRKALPEPGQIRRVADQPYEAPVTPLETLIAELWQDVLKVERVGCLDHFFELGGDSIKGAIFANRMQERIGSVFYVVALFESPTIRQLVDYMGVHYPEAVRLIDGSGADLAASLEKINEEDASAFHDLIPPLAPCPAILGRARNPRAVFVLAPPRSGTTLMRVLLGGHPRLFAPPELELMPFNTLGERRRVCSGKDAFWLEGTLRALMEIHKITPDEAKAMMDVREQEDRSVMEFYGEMQGWLGDRMLVDKSPSYVLHASILERIEQTFDEPVYVHLHRHPLGMIHSFEEAKLHQIFFRPPHAYEPTRLAELIWLESHRNISAFLGGIPSERQITIGFESMTADPESFSRRFCDLMGLPFDARMLSIHGGGQASSRMTDGLHKESKMLGDVKFHTHRAIDPTVGERWRAAYREDFLGYPTWRMADELGYSREQAFPALKVAESAPAAPPVPTATAPAQRSGYQTSLGL